MFRRNLISIWQKAADIAYGKRPANMERMSRDDVSVLLAFDPLMETDGLNRIFQKIRDNYIFTGVLDLLGSRAVKAGCKEVSFSIDEIKPELLGIVQRELRSLMLEQGFVFNKNMYVCLRVLDGYSVNELRKCTVLLSQSFFDWYSEHCEEFKNTKFLLRVLK